MAWIPCISCLPAEMRHTISNLINAPAVINLPCPLPNTVQTQCYIDLPTVMFSKSYIREQHEFLLAFLEDIALPDVVHSSGKEFASTGANSFPEELTFY